MRILQSPTFSQFSRPVKAAVLFAPAIFPRLLVGQWGFVTKDSLTDNPAAFSGEIKPCTPLKSPCFAFSLLWNSYLARQPNAFPSGLPIFILLGGEKEDRYIHTKKTLRWINSIRSRCSDHIILSRDANGYHALDNNLRAKSARSLAAAFAGLLLLEGASARQP